MLVSPRATCSAFCLLVLSCSQVHATLIQAFQTSGTVAVETTAAGLSAAPSQLGALSLSALPVGAVINQAYFYAVDINHGGTLSGTFAGAPLLATPAYMADAGGLTNLETFRWDVTPFLVPGVTNYSFAGCSRHGPGR